MNVTADPIDKASERATTARALPAFALRVVAFMVPFFLLFALPVYVLVRSGEMTPLRLDDVVLAQRGSPGLLLYGPAYTNINKPFKVRASLLVHPRVLVVGTSRSMQVRASLFDPGVTFYNAGGSVSRMGHLRKLLARIPRDTQPEILLVALDQWFFNGRTEAAFEADWSAQVDTKADVLGVLSNWTTVYRDWQSQKFTLQQLASPPTPALGLNAIVNENGFRNDGSFFYGAVTRHPDDPAADSDRTFAVTLARVRGGSTRFEYADHVDAALLAELGAFLAEAKARGIYVVGWATSYAPSVIDEMRRGGHYGYIDEIYPSARPLFEAQGFHFFDFADIAPLGSTDAEFIDGIHASEYAHLRMMGRMLDEDARLRTVTSVERIEALRRASAGPLALADERWR